MLAAFALATATAVAPVIPPRTVLATWDDESLAVEDIYDDFATLVVSLPKAAGAAPSASIVGSANMLTPCEVTSITEKEGRILVALKLGEMVFDDGWNGCTAELRRGHPSDEDGLGILTIDFGLQIDD